MQTIRTVLSATTLTVTLFIFSTAPLAHADAQFEAYLDGLVAAQFNDYDLAGMTFVLIKDGEILLAKGYGLADIASSTPVDPEVHMFRPGSVSKLLTWTAVMQLVEQGKLDLSTDVAEYVSQFDLPNEFDTPLTLNHILTHTPGLEDRFTNLFSDTPDAIRPLAESLAAGMPNQIRKPGTQSSYSNWATALAGLIVANVSDMSFEDYVQQNILEPLNMRASTFDEPLPAALADNMATGYVTDSGELAPLGFEYIKNFGPAGALSATATDLANFMLAHLHEGQFGEARILSADTTRQMHAVLFQHADDVAAMAHGFYEKWHNGQRFIGHGGDTIAFHSELLLDPTNAFGFFVSFNAVDGAQARSGVVNGVLNYFYGTPERRFVFPTLPDSAKRIAQVVGNYRINRRSYTTVEALVGLGGDIPVVPGSLEGSINIPVPNLGGMFYEVEPFVFQKSGGTTQLKFTKDPQGNVAHLLFAPVPVMAADKMSPIASANTHQLLIPLTLIASLFVLINYVRNRRDGLEGNASRGRLALTGAAISFLLFAIVMGLQVAGLDMNRIPFEFPPTGLGVALVFPIIGAVLTLLAWACLIPVWQAAACNVWARLRYTFVLIVFTLFLLVMNYWNMLGWMY